MPITVDWFDTEQTIVRYEFLGRWSWTELHTAVDEVQDMLASVDHRVDIIIDVSQNVGIPSGAIIQMKSGSMKANKNWGMGVFVGTGAFINALITSFTRIYPKMAERYAIAMSIDEAQKLIIERRTTTT
jgi:hypothetical protein